MIENENQKQINLINAFETCESVLKQSFKEKNSKNELMHSFYNPGEDKIDFYDPV